MTALVLFSSDANRVVCGPEISFGTSDCRADGAEVIHADETISTLRTGVPTMPSRRG